MPRLPLAAWPAALPAVQQKMVSGFSSIFLQLLRKKKMTIFESL